MGRDFRRILTGLGLLFSMVPLAWAVTGMVAVQIDLSRAGTSPDGLRRARQTALDMESTLMDRLFDDGHIAFNAPSEIHQPDAAEPLTAIENLLSSGCRVPGYSPGDI